MSEDVGWFIFFECDVNSERAHLSTTHTLSECCLSSHTTPGQRGRGKNVQWGTRIVPHWTFAPPSPAAGGYPDFQPHPEIRDFVTGTPFYPVPYCPNAFLFRYNVKHERACPSPTYTHPKTGKAPNSPRALIVSVARQKIKAADGVGRFDFRKLYLQFLQFLESEAFLEAFACLPDCALPLSLAAEDCLPFALDLVFSMFTPFGGSPRVQTFACRG